MKMKEMGGEKSNNKSGNNSANKIRRKIAALAVATKGFYPYRPTWWKFW